MMLLPKNRQFRRTLQKLLKEQRNVRNCSFSAAHQPVLTSAATACFVIQNTEQRADQNMF